MVQFILFSMLSYIRWSIAEYYMFMHPYPCQYGEPADLLSMIIHAKCSLYWGGRGPASHPFLANNSFF